MRRCYKSIGFCLLILLNTFLAGAAAKEKAYMHTKKAAAVFSPKMQMSEHTEDLRSLMLQLYENHPEELEKSTQVSAREMTEWVFDNKSGWQFDAIKKLRGEQALSMVLDPDYQGDHILPLIVGLETLLFNAYGAKNEFDINPEIDGTLLAQALCNIKTLSVNLKSATSKREPMALVHFLEKSNTEQVINVAIDNIVSRIVRAGRGNIGCQQ